MEPTTQWKIGYYREEKFVKWLKSLGTEKYSSLYEEIQLLATYGNELILPHSRALGKGLFELRERAYGLRVYYTFRDGRIVLLLQGGDKSSQKDDIKKCLKLIKTLN